MIARGHWNNSIIFGKEKRNLYDIDFEWFLENNVRQHKGINLLQVGYPRGYIILGAFLPVYKSKQKAARKNIEQGWDLVDYEKLQ